MRNVIVTLLKGIGMEAANVIPGVSGGTIALITGIFERLIQAIKAFNLTALRLLVSGRFRDLARHTDLGFLTAIGIGVALAVLTFARVLKLLFTDHPILIGAFFFGLILASVLTVGATIVRWRWSTVLMVGVGAAVACGLSFGTPAESNSGIFYLVLCGVVGACSMILPGLSGSYVLLLMGNYELVMIDAVNLLTHDPVAALRILLPVVVGAGVGIVGCARILARVYQAFRDQTTGLLTGFIFGSLATLWPWKTPVMTVLSDGREKVAGYEWLAPGIDGALAAALGCMVLGAAVILLTERLARRVD